MQDELKQINAKKLLRVAEELGALTFGDFTLSSGQKSNYYFDGRLLTLSPLGSSLIATLLLPSLRNYGAKAVGGPAVGAVPLVAAIVMQSGLDGGNQIPGFFVRKESKEHDIRKKKAAAQKKSTPLVLAMDCCNMLGVGQV